MIIAKSCPACGAADGLSWPALIAPFIQDYALKAKVDTCRLIECPSCSLRYFDTRYEPHELQAIYQGYRESAYQRARQRHEHGYTRAFNDSLGNDAESRNSALMGFLAANGVAASSATVVDYGGDTGKYIPACFHGPRFVYDISGKPTVDGVGAIQNPDDLKALRPGFVLLAHVLEHLPEPLTVIQHIRSIVPKDGKLYVEVPFERPNLRWLGRGRAYEEWLKLISRWTLGRKVVELYDAIARRTLNVIPPLGIALQHEHINLFDERSLRALLGRGGFRVTHARTEPTLVRVLAEPVAG